MVNRRNLLVSAAAVAISGRTLRLARAQDSTPTPTTSLGWSDDFEVDNGLINVATTVAPISSIVRNVVGNRADVHGIVPDGTNSHTFAQTATEWPQLFSLLSAHSKAFSGFAHATTH